MVVRSRCKNLRGLLAKFPTFECICVYRNSLIVALTNKDLKVNSEKGFEVIFLGKRVGIFIPDLIIEDEVIVELKCCQNLTGEHQAQLINYLAVTKIEVGLLVNFGNRKLEFKRVYHPSYPAACDPAYTERD